MDPIVAAGPEIDIAVVQKTWDAAAVALIRRFASLGRTTMFFNGVKWALLEGEGAEIPGKGLEFPSKVKLLILVHHEDRAKLAADLFPETHRIYYSGHPPKESDQRPEKGDWIHRAMSADAITSAEAAELCAWIEGGRKAAKPELLSGDHQKTGLLVALSILCQAYLAQYALQGDVAEPAVAKALSKMGWRGDVRPAKMARRPLETQSPLWWRQGLDLQANQAVNQASEHSDAIQDLLAKIVADEGAFSPALVARAYEELTFKLETVG